MYYEEQQLKAEDEKRLTWEADSIDGYEPPECFCGDICKM
jgi:hypothetical protein